MNEYYHQLSQQQLVIEFCEICEKRDLKTVKYLLTSLELEKKLCINNPIGLGFKTTCQKGHLVKEYLND